MTDDITEDSDTVHAVVRPSSGRRGVGIGALAILGGLLLYLGLTQGNGAGAQMFLIFAGLAGIAAAEALRRGSGRTLELTTTELRDSAGNRLALVSDILRVERGAFAFKPSNGFLVRTSVPGPFYWAPGLWWRIGRRVGVGGVTSASATKAMAEILAFQLAERDADKNA